MNHLKQLYKSSLTLLTDFYQLTMACGYWRAGMAEREAVFHLFFRHSPFSGGYAMAAGLKTVIDHMTALRFTKKDVDYLAGIKGNNNKPLFDSKFLHYLKKLKFTVDVDAVEEGTVVFAHEPLLRVKGPLLQCQLLETALLNIVNFQTLIATKTSRICYAAKGDPVVEFGARRAQGIDGCLSASRAAYIGGCVGTSNTLAGKLYGIPVRGTHAHSWIMAFESELEAFKTYADTLPNNGIFLVDTYHTLEGVKRAITVGKELKRKGYSFAGVRLDSGDLAALSKQTRKLLDKAGFYSTNIMASNELDEYVISSLKEQNAKINVWGVGTKLVTAHNQPALDGVYKLSAIRNTQGKWEYKLKLSEQTIKISPPGLMKVRRFYQKGIAIGDAIYDEALGIQNGCTLIEPLDMTHRYRIPTNARHKELLKPILRKGKLVYDVPSLEKTRAYALANIKEFHEGIRRFLNPHKYPVGLEKKLYELKTQLILKMTGA